MIRGDILLPLRGNLKKLLCRPFDCLSALAGDAGDRRSVKASGVEYLRIASVQMTIIIRWRQRDMEQSIPRFDMKRPPVRTRWFLRPLTWLLSVPDVVRHGTVIRKVNVDNLRPPYVLFCNHNAFLDFKVATIATFPHRANYVVAIDGFIGRENLLRQVGCICKRKFTNDTTLVRQLRQVIRNGDIAMIYPEARYSLCGTTAVLPASLGKLCKLLKAPVVTLICHGHHLNSPFWNLHSRGVCPTEAELTQIFTAEELENASVEEINGKLLEMFQYDDFAWQKERGIRTTYKKRAEGLHKVLYQCPNCGSPLTPAEQSMPPAMAQPVAQY